MTALKRILLLFVWAPIGIVLVSLAIANRQTVSLALDPFSPEAPALAVQVPLFAVIFGALLAGILIGGFMAWLKQGRHRKAARTNRYDAKKWRNEADRQQKRVEALAAENKPAGPALPAPGA